MSLVLLFRYLMLNMFRMLVHPSSGACDLFVEIFMFFLFINFITLHAPLLWSNTTCIEVNFYILSSTIYLFHLQFWYLI